MVYFKFLFNNKINEEKTSFKEKVIGFILSHVLPNANPDFDNRYKDVVTWYIEYDDKNCCPCREVGVDLNDNAIVMAPYKKNYGYWMDTNMTIETYTNQYDIIYINKNIFENIWEKSIKKKAGDGSH